MFYEIVFWGGPKDGHVERQTFMPSDQVFCVNNTSPLLDIQAVRLEMQNNPVKTQYCIYALQRLSKRKYKYIFSGFL